MAEINPFKGNFSYLFSTRIEDALPQNKGEMSKSGLLSELDISKFVSNHDFFVELNFKRFTKQKQFEGLCN